MEYVSRFIDFFFSFKAYVMLPIIIFLIALIVRMKVQDAFLSALKLGAGFAGIFVVFDFFVANIGPAVKAIISIRGLDYPVLDVGWPPLAAITWSSIIAPLTIPLILLINMGMIAGNMTRTVNIDIWNYWHFALIGALIQKTTNSYLLAFIATALIGIYAIKMADWTTPYVEEECGIKGICITTLSVNGLLPLGVACNKLFDKIPGFRKLSYNPSKSKDSKLKILNEPMVIGILVGVFLSLLAGYQVKESMELCVHIAAVMFLLPHCGTLIGKGMEPISLKLKEAIQKRFPKKTDLAIGMDSGVIMTNPSVLTTGILLMPIAIAVAFILPGNKVIPLGDLPNVISVMAVIVLIMRGNVIRSVILGIPIVAGYLLIATGLAPLYTDLSKSTGMTFEGNYDGLITAFTDGGNPVRYWFFHLFRGNLAAIILIPVILALMYLSYRNYKRMTAGGK